MKTGSMVMNILGLVLLFPSVVCSSVCGTVVGASMSESDKDAAAAYGVLGTLGTWGGFLICVVASILGFLALKKPKSGLAIAAGVGMLIGGLLNLSQILSGNILALVVGLCYIVAGILTLLMKPEAQVS